MTIITFKPISHCYYSCCCCCYYGYMKGTGSPKGHSPPHSCTRHISAKHTATVEAWWLPWYPCADKDRRYANIDLVATEYRPSQYQVQTVHAGIDTHHPVTQQTSREDTVIGHTENCQHRQHNVHWTITVHLNFKCTWSFIELMQNVHHWTHKHGSWTFHLNISRLKHPHPHPHCLFHPLVGRHSEISAFPVAASRAWNSLPADVKDAPSLLTFRRRLKTFLFHSSYGRHW